MQEAEWCNSENDTPDPGSPTWSPYGPEKAHKIAVDLSKALLKVFPACSGCSIIHTCKQKKDEFRADFKAHLKALFLRHSDFHTIDDAAQPALTALLVNVFSPEISRLIKRQKIEWEVTGLTKF